MHPTIKKRLWAIRTELGNRATFSGGTYFSEGRPWYGWHQLPRDVDTSPMSIAYAFVATHNHFILDREVRLFNHAAPLIKLRIDASEEDHLALLGLLNSSAACFWLKEKSQEKGGAADARWARTYEFTGTTLKNFPLPMRLPSHRSRALDSLAKRLVDYLPQTVAQNEVPTHEALDAAQAEHECTRSMMIAHQEELDWEIYRLYGLIDEDLTYSGVLPCIKLGERAFEIVLARATESGKETAWFERHDSTPTSEIPEHWPTDYRELVQRRLSVIASNNKIRLLEQPEYKRRWAIQPWEKRVQAALKDWLLDRVEDRALWFDREGRPQPRSVSQLADVLARNEDFRIVLELWARRPDVPTVTALQDLLADQAVPFLAAHRYKPSGLEKRKAWVHTWELQRKEDAGELPLDPKTKLPDPPIPVPPKYKPADFAKPAYWEHRGKLDVPKERFILYPDANRETDPTPLLGWAGWDHAQQALALAAIMNERETEGWTDERIVPLIAGLAELQPWVRQWHGEVDPTYGVSLAAIIDEELAGRAQRAGKTLDDLAAWRPAATGRSRRSTTKNGGGA
ncbi:BREX-2 system adenine-specific DNA-methyltransferase PglX [Kibdelosporangium philippinense]|uniref:site-specific DNA-methyltransferase (adenine-specific) n=1 Tax=Kibdelosporangium philippinense TaxID=211113 RepID=A0ABS8Z140_9PSEU|nr:BREX-2 system adenine-specific DNA-methyltransferase PglX [Kibdelosporangium philippinense]